jgi:aspartate carbamoyltransferase catalytic subunit
MSLSKRDLVTVDDLSNREIESIFRLADEMSDALYEQSTVCQGKIMASLFFEPSTRTRLSFEAAMHRLGGNVITAMDVKATSLAKGESIADMARVIGSYADIMVIRHPWEGAAKVAAEYAGIPVINAGDGGHEHPTQTLCDLFSLKKEKGSIEGLNIALCGDLKYGRTIHSLTYALARMGATIIFCPGDGYEIPDYVVKKLTEEYGGELRKVAANDVPSLAGVVSGDKAELDALYLTPSTPHQPALLTDLGMRVDLKQGVDALYVTRLQKERTTASDQDGDKSYPVIDQKTLKGKEFKETLVMHPLPRVDELAYDMDSDPRSIYFKQAARGVPVRMALIAMLLGAKNVEMPDDGIRKGKYPIYQREFGARCHNPNCAAVHEARYINPKFAIVNFKPLTLRCVYCEREIAPKYMASTKWHQGTIENKLYHNVQSHLLTKIDTDNMLFFESEEDAQANGFKPSRFAQK